MRAEDGMEGTGIILPQTTAPILLATDGSVQAEQAAQAAIELADATGSELHLVHVGVMPNFLGNGPGTMGYDGMLYEQIEREAREVLRKLTWRTKVADGTVAAAHLRLGGVAEEIIGLAEEIGAGMIVMGSRGRGRLRRFLLGSVSGSVVRHALCSVLVVRPEREGSIVARACCADRQWFVLRAPSKPSTLRPLCGASLARQVRN